MWFQWGNGGQRTARQRVRVRGGFPMRKVIPKHILALHFPSMVEPCNFWKSRTDHREKTPFWVTQKVSCVLRLKHNIPIDIFSFRWSCFFLSVPYLLNRSANVIPMHFLHICTLRMDWLRCFPYGIIGILALSKCATMQGVQRWLYWQTCFGNLLRFPHYLHFGESKMRIMQKMQCCRVEYLLWFGSPYIYTPDPNQTRYYGNNVTEVTAKKEKPPRCARRNP